MAELDEFKNYFREYQEKFGLSGWQVYFKHEKLDGSYADIKYTLDDMVATARLNNKVSRASKPFHDIKKNAKHEALHLLIARLEGNACHRWVSQAEIAESSEELVNKLCNLIQD